MRNRLKSLAKGLLVFGFCLCLGGGYMNYQGVCLVEGRSLTEKERINRVVGYVLEKYPQAVLPVILDESGVKRRWVLIDINETKNLKIFGRVPPEQPVYYKGVQDFLSANPNCCTLKKELFYDEDNEPVSFSGWEKITNGVTGDVRGKYLVKFLDAGIIKSVEVMLHAEIDNCGDIEDIDYKPVYLN